MLLSKRLNSSIIDTVVLEQSIQVKEKNFERCLLQIKERTGPFLKDNKETVSMRVFNNEYRTRTNSLFTDHQGKDTQTLTFAFEFRSMTSLKTYFEKLKSRGRSMIAVSICLKSYHHAFEPNLQCPTRFCR